MTRACCLTNADLIIRFSISDALELELVHRLCELSLSCRQICERKTPEVLNGPRLRARQHNQIRRRRKKTPQFHVFV